MNFGAKVFFPGRFIFPFAMAALLFSATGPASAQNSEARAATSPKIRWASVAELNAAPAETYLYLQGTIKSIKTPDPGTRQPYIIYVSDGDSAARIVIFQDTWTRIGNPERFDRGLVLQAFGKVNDYKGTRQLIAEGPRWIRLAPVQPTLAGRSSLRDSATANTGPTLVSIGGISLGTIDKTVRVQGRITEISHGEKSNIPTKVKVRDNTGEIVVVYWDEIRGTLPSYLEPETGAEWEVTGQVGEYKGELQIQPDGPEAIRRPKVLSRAGRY